MSWSSMTNWDHSVPRGGTAMGWNLSDQSSSTKTSDGNTYSIGSPGAMSLGGYSPGNYENSSYTTDYAGAAFSSVSFDNPSSSSSQYPYPKNHDNARVTPTTLGWTPDTQLWKVYKFVVGKGKEPYLELLPGFNVTYETPVRVYLDHPRQQKKGKQCFPCQFPGGCLGKQTVFTRPADLERHYIQVHAPVDDRPSFKCDYGKCQRAKERPFTRKDHYRDHLRDYHKEDLGSAKGEKNFKGERLHEWQAMQERWLAERQISPKWWRCARCLVKVCVRESGWECKECKGVCEPERRDTRQRLVKDAAVIESTTSYTSNCSTCNGTAWIESAYIPGSWDACPNCQPSAVGEYDVTGMDSAQYSSSSYY